MLKNRNRNIAVVLLIGLFLFITVMDAHARAGSRRSFGSRGSRSYYTKQQTTNPSQQTTKQSNQYSNYQKQQTGTNPAGMRTQARPSMMRSIATGIAGGFLGSMLFSGLSHGMGMGGFGGSGIGLIEIIVMGLLLYGAYRMFSGRKPRHAQSQAAATGKPFATGYAPDPPPLKPAPSAAPFSGPSTPPAGTMSLRQLDGNLDEATFKDQCMDIFFEIQGAWATRNMDGAKSLLTGETYGILQADADELKAKGLYNKLDNIAVRSVNVMDVWQEDGQDYVTVKFLANILDYTVNEAGELVSGSKNEPVKFEEYWTLTRPSGSKNWLLSAIEQAQ